MVDTGPANPRRIEAWGEKSNIELTKRNFFKGLGKQEEISVTENIKIITPSYTTSIKHRDISDLSIRSDLSSISSFKTLQSAKGKLYCKAGIKDKGRLSRSLNQDYNRQYSLQNAHSEERLLKSESVPNMKHSKTILDSQTPDIWRELENHIVSINDDTGYGRPQLNIKPGSDIHQKLIEDERRRRKARREGLKKAINMTRNFTRLKLLGQNPTEPESDSEDDEGDVKHKSRGWVVLRRYLQEKRLEKKLKESTGGWNLISKAVVHMTDVERSRQNLYERYLDKPHAWRKGLRNYEQYRHLFDSNAWKNRQKELVPKSSTEFRQSGAGMQRYNTSTSLDNLQKEPPMSVAVKKRPNTAFVNSKR